MLPFEFEDKVYALLETQSFPIMFYRKDILTELGLRVPETWEDFYKLIPEIQKNNMEIGFPSGTAAGATTGPASGLTGVQIFLYQNGGSLYNEDLSRATLDQDLTIDAFQQLCELFTTYRFPRVYEFANRFRTGQMPIGIQDYTVYNNLVAFAPEIKGLWGIAPIPGTLQDDGTINRAAPSTGTCAIMMKDAENRDAAWKFMEWWTNAESQSRFAEEMETVLGKAAKYPTANMEAMSKMPWTQSEYETLMEQWNQLVGTPEIPGGYYVSRSIDFAIATAFITGDGEVLFDYAKDANEEITRKRKEYDVK
jgi:ABC-type glycerol-3-phosphate transport system substrate-binding protein